MTTHPERFIPTDRRITPVRLLGAYHQTGLRPRQKVCLSNGYADVLGAIELAEGFQVECRHDLYLLAGCLGLPVEYVRGVVHGFNGHAPWELARDGYLLGHSDGLACWRAVAHLAHTQEVLPP